MSDESPFPPSDTITEAPKPRGGIANLLPPCKPGEVRNKYGRNGRDKNKILVDFMEEVDPRDKKERTRIRAFLETTYLRALAGHSVAIKYIGEQYAGKAGLPKKGIPVTVPTGVDKTRSTYDIALETYRERLLSGELSEDELLAVTKIFADNEKSEAEAIARILGDKSEINKPLRDRVERLLERMEARMNAAEAPKVIDAQVVESQKVEK